MKQSAKRIVSLLVSLGLIVAAIVLFSSLIRPAYREVQEIKGELISRRNVLETQQSAVQQVRDLLDAYQGEDQISQTLSLALPEEKREAEAVHIIGQLAGAVGLEVQSISATTPGARNVATGRSTLVRPTGTLELQARLSGSFNDFSAFLGDIETNLRVMDVGRVTISPSGEVGEDAYDFNVTVVTYYQTK